MSLIDSPGGGGFQNKVATILPGSVTADDIADGAITSVKISTHLQSDNWDGTTVAAEDATQGWRIEKDTGNFGAESAILRGDFKSGSGDNQVTIEGGITKFGQGDDRIVIDPISALGHIDFYSQNVYRGAVNSTDDGIRIFSNGSQRLLIGNHSGDVDILTQGGRIDIGLTSIGTGPSIITLNSEGDIDLNIGSALRITGATEAMRFGKVNEIVFSRWISNKTTGLGPNINIDASNNGLIRRSTSALKHKTKLTKADHLADIDLQPMKFYRKDDKRYMYGFIADWLGEQDKLLGEYNDEGEIENFDTRAIMAVMAAKINRLERSVL